MCNSETYERVIRVSFKDIKNVGKASELYFEQGVHTNSPVEKRNCIAYTPDNKFMKVDP